MQRKTVLKGNEEAVRAQGYTNTNANSNTNTKYRTKMSKLVDMANQSPDSQVAVAVRLKAACHLDGLIIRLRERNLVV